MTSICAIASSRSRKDQRTPFSFRYIHIPCGWPITWLFLRLGVGPNQAVFLRLLAVLVSFVLMAGGLLAEGVCLYLFALVLDTVDGSISRVRDTGNWFGKYIDGLVDSHMEIPMPIMLAIGIGPDAYVAGALSSLGYGLAQVTQMRHLLIGKDVRGLVGRPTFPLVDNSCRRERMAWVEIWVPNIVFDYRYTGIIVALAVGELLVFLYVLAALQIVSYLCTFTIRTLWAAEEFNVWRRGKNDVRT